MLEKVFSSTATPMQSSYSFIGNETDALRDCTILKRLNFSEEFIADFLYHVRKLKSGKELHTINENTCYCNGTMRNIATGYRNVHGYVSLFVCIFGTLANSINIAVLTRREMKTAPFTYILTWLAVTDMMLMIEYIPFALYNNMYMDPESKMARFSYSGAIFMLIHTHLSQVLHTMSICLTLTLAFWRHNAIR